jgi:hypothetical protein
MCVCSDLDSSETSSFSEEMGNIKVFEDSWVFTQGILAMTMTKTKYGISTKDLIGNVLSIRSRRSTMLI